MYIRLENAELLTRRTFQEVQQAILQHKDFLDALSTDSDWAFIIKIHAFLEALLTSLIRSHSGSFRLGDMASRLPMNSSDGISKLELVKANQLLNSDQMRFIRRIGEIRNRLAHEAEMVNAFSLVDYVSEFDGNQIKNWRRDMTYFLLDYENGFSSDIAVNDPRYAITEALLDLICQIEGSRVQVDINSDIQAVAKADTNQLLDSLVEQQVIQVVESSHTFELGGDS